MGLGYGRPILASGKRMHANGTVAVLACVGMSRLDRAGHVGVLMTDDPNICAHCGEPVGEHGSAVFECVHCLVRWCQACDFIRDDRPDCLFCGKDFMTEAEF
jgi:hypothetical protein